MIPLVARFFVRAAIKRNVSHCFILLFQIFFIYTKGVTFWPTLYLLGAISENESVASVEGVAVWISYYRMNYFILEITLE